MIEEAMSCIFPKASTLTDIQTGYKKKLVCRTHHANWKEKKKSQKQKTYNFYKYEQVSEHKSHHFEKQQFLKATLLQIPLDLSSSVRAKSMQP